MTLDEAIKHCEEVAHQKDLESGFETDNERYAMTDKERTDCKKCAEEHRQLAEWLKELKRYKELFEKLDDVITKQIDESDNQVECQTLRWVLDTIGEVYNDNNC